MPMKIHTGKDNFFAGFIDVPPSIVDVMFHFSMGSFSCTCRFYFINAYSVKKRLYHI